MKSLFFICVIFFQANCFGQFQIDFNSKRPTQVILLEQLNDPINAANLLQKYCNEITGKSLPITNKAPKKGKTIHIQQDISLHPDGYMISIEKNNIQIYGGERKGCTYAVIYLLESYLGCKYLSPTIKVVPKSESINLPFLTYKDEPKNDRRIINLYYENCTQEYIDWNRLYTIEEIYPPNYFVHTFHRFLPWETYFKEHPEYFALLENKQRSIDQLCPSHPKVKEIIAAQLKEEMAKLPNQKVWSVSQNDNFSYCQCENCSKIIAEDKSPSGPIIRLVNDIALAFPDKIISTLAYQYSRKAPEVTVPRNNVEVMLCSIELHRQESIVKDVDAKSFRDDMIAWGKIANNILIWDYTINFNHSISPFPNLHTLKENCQFFTDNNVNAVFEQSNSSKGFEFSELKVYLLSRLMWDPDRNIDDLKAEFLNLYYGKAGPAIGKYIKSLEENLAKTNSKMWIYEHPVVHENGLFSIENMNYYKVLFNKAEESVKDDQKFLNRVKLARLPIQYAEMEIATNHMFETRGWYRIEGQKAIQSEELFQTFKKFKDVCIINKVPAVNEALLTPMDYCNSLERMISVSLDGNKAFEKQVIATVAPDMKYSQGNLSYLTNGVNGASDYSVHWLGWFGKNTDLTVDLESIQKAENITIGSLWNGKSWILHPKAIRCFISEDGKKFELLGESKVEGDQEKEKINVTHAFQTNGKSFRYVKFEIEGTSILPNWHPSAGQTSWFFVDEIIVK
jgi:hypothetical protein